jgi:hypothetical protein
VTLSASRSLVRLLMLGAVLAAPLLSAGAASSKVTLRGQVRASILGESSPLSVEGEQRALVLTLDPIAPNGMPDLRRRRQVNTDSDSKFLLRNVDPGVYQVRVRVSGIPAREDTWEIYRGRVEVKPGLADQSVEIKSNWLAMRIRGAEGQPFQGSVLRFNVQRLGGKLKQRWGSLTFQITRNQPARPGGAVEEGGGIQIHIDERELGQYLNVGYGWSGKEPGVIYFPIVEEDEAVKYLITLTVPGAGCAPRQFTVNRGTAPSELEFRLQPFNVVSGTLKIEGVNAQGRNARIAATVLDPEAMEVIHRSFANPRPDGTFSILDLPPGLVKLRVEVFGRTPEGKDAQAVGVTWFTMKDRERKEDVALVVAPVQPEKVPPGDVYLTLKSEGGEPVTDAEIRAIPEGETESIGSYYSTGYAGDINLESLRPDNYVLRVFRSSANSNDKPKAVLEIPLTEKEVRQGLRRVITIPNPKAAA